MKKLIIQLDTLTCPSCIAKIEGALKTFSGITDTKIMFNASKVKVSFDPSEVSEQEISDKIQDLGFDIKDSKIKDI